MRRGSNQIPNSVTIFTYSTSHPALTASGSFKAWRTIPGCGIKLPDCLTSLKITPLHKNPTPDTIELAIRNTSSEPNMIGNIRNRREPIEIKRLIRIQAVCPVIWRSSPIRNPSNMESKIRMIKSIQLIYLPSFILTSIKKSQEKSHGQTLAIFLRFGKN